MTDILRVVFWGCAGLTLYAYAGYPLLAAAWASLMQPHSKGGGNQTPGNAALPEVSLIVPVYNEEGVIERKIRNTRDLDYPGSLLEVVVVSDGSRDATETLARRAAGGQVRLLFMTDRKGKTACINEALPSLRGEIVVFTDANAYFRPEALKELVQRFGDPQIGCVMGQLDYVREGSLNASLGEGLYWRYENFIKEQESRLGSTIVGNGAIYAMRRSLCRALPLVVEADVVNPLLALRAGYRVVFERRARCWERTTATVREEASRKTRIITNQITSYLYGWKELRPMPAGAVFQVFSHKLLRWLVPLFLTGILVSCAVLAWGSPLFGAVMGVQLLFYLLGGLGWIAESKGMPIPRLLFLPYYVCGMNVASVKGMADFLRGRRWVVWEKVESTR